MRKLVLDNGIWLWRYVKGTVIIKNPQGKKYLTDKSEISGVSWESFDNGYMFAVTPSVIKDWIEKNCV